MATHAMGSVGVCRPLCRAQTSSAAPAGIRRQEATSSGVVCGASCFMATMEVPQKKKGDTSRAASSNAASGPAGSGGQWEQSGEGGWVQQVGQSGLSGSATVCERELAARRAGHLPGAAERRAAARLAAPGGQQRGNSFACLPDNCRPPRTLPSPLSGSCVRCWAAAGLLLLLDTAAGSSPGTGTWGGPSCTSRHSTSMPVPKHSRCGSTDTCCCPASAGGARSTCCCRSMAAQRSWRRAARLGRAAAAAGNRAAPVSGPAARAVSPAARAHALGSMAGGGGGPGRERGWSQEPRERWLAGSLITHWQRDASDCKNRARVLGNGDLARALQGGRASFPPSRTPRRVAH